MYINVKYVRKSTKLHMQNVTILPYNLFERNLNPTTFHILTMLLVSILIVVVVILLLTKP